MSWPTQEQFDEAARLGSEAALAEYQNGATAAQEAPLSGEWADAPTARSVAAQVGWQLQQTDDYRGSAWYADGESELANAWERGYFDAWAHVDEDQG